MDALDEYIARRRKQWIGVLTVIASLIAVVVETAVIYRVWIKPVPDHRGFNVDVIPVMTAFPLLLCLSMQLGIRKALKSGDISSKIATVMEGFGAALILITYQAIGELMRLVP